jgi:hypothetical protein
MSVINDHRSLLEAVNNYYTARILLVIVTKPMTGQSSRHQCFNNRVGF